MTPRAAPLGALLIAAAFLVPSVPCSAQDLLLDLDRQFQAHWSAGRYKDAESVGKRMLEVAQSDTSTSPLNLAACLNNLANVYAALGKNREAVPLHERALAIRRRQRGDDDLLVADSLNNLASVERDLHQLADAEKHFRQAMEIRWQRLPQTSPEVTGSLNNLALVYKEQGRFQASEEYYQKSLELKRRRVPPDELDVAATLNNLGDLYDAQGRLADAQAVFEEALAVRQRRLHAEHPDLATVLNNLGVALMKQGRFAEAEPLYKRALSIRQIAFPPEHPYVADTLNNLALLYMEQGRFEDAEKRFRRALSIHEQIGGADSAGALAVVNNLGILYKRQRKFVDAEAMYRRSLAAAEKAHGSGNIAVYPFVLNLASALVNLDRHDEARSLFSRAARMLESSLPADHPDVADVLYNLADLEQIQGRLQESEKLLDRAIAIRVAASVPPGDIFQAYELRADVRQARGNLAGAKGDLNQALLLAENQRSLGAGHESDRASAFAAYLPAFEKLMQWQAAAGQLEEALRTSERARARSLVDQMQLRGVDLLAGVPDQQARELKRRQDENQRRVAELETQAQLLQVAAGLTDSERWDKFLAIRKSLAEARQEAIDIYRDIRTVSPACRLAASRPLEPPSLADVQSWLKAQNALLLSYIIGESGVYSLVIAGDADPRLIKVAPSEAVVAAWGMKPGTDIDSQVPAALAAELSQVMLLLSRPAGASQAGRRLELLWEFLVPEVERTALVEGNYERLYVVPDGALAWLPFETLAVRRGLEPQYLLDEGPPIGYAPSVSVLLELAQRPPAPLGSRAAEPLLTVGDVAYDAQTGSVDSRSASGRFFSLGGKLAPLPYSGTESHWVAEVFRQNGLSARRLTQREVTEAAVRREAPGRKFLHFACHGFVDQSHGNLFGSLAFAPGPHGAAAADDGFLTLAEIYEMDLAGCELAILSACETNYGPHQRGEGVLGLSRGFLAAGARRTIASNWLVDDEAAASLVSQLCRDVAAAEKAHRPPDYAAALHAAKRWVRKQEKWRSPYYWGQFVLTGPN